MVKYYTGFGSMTDVGVGTTGGAVANMPNHGLSYVTANETYCLQAPYKGARKMLVCVSTSTAAGAVVLAATSSGNITFNQAGHGKISFAAATTERQVVELVGLSSNQWAITNAYPVASSGAGPVTTTY